MCKICFGSTSHKPNPLLTPESKAKLNVSTEKKECSVCCQEWVPIRVAKEIGAGVGADKWVRIRPKPQNPAIIEFRICESLQSRTECPKGHDCLYAHSRAELLSWNAKQHNEPRPAPHSGAYQLCKRMRNTGMCRYGQQCKFAHSEEELRSWSMVKARTNEVPNTNAVMGGTPIDFKLQCNVCDLLCTDKKQLDDHLDESRNKQKVALHAYNSPPPAQSIWGNPSIRQRPLLSSPLNEYMLCPHVKTGRRCIHGDYCTFAHSLSELKEWNYQLQIANTPHLSRGIVKFQEGGPPPHPSLKNTMPGVVSMGVGVGGTPTCISGNRKIAQS